MARIRAALAAIAVLAGVASGGLVASGLAAPGAAAAAPHRVMVVVETGGATYHQVVTFSEDSISGLRALELAGAQPVVYSFAGQGGAVCRLFGVGRDAGPNCLGGADGDNRYWAYLRAPAGTTSFTYSRSGAGATQVHDGDVEGWKFGTGTAPAYAALPPVTTTTTGAPVVAPPGGGSGGPGVGSTGGGTSGAVMAAPMNLDPEALARFLAAASTTTTTLSPASANAATSERAATEVEGRRTRRAATAAAGDTDGGDGDGGAGSLVLFAIVAVALVGGGLLLRRSRRRPVP